MSNWQQAKVESIKDVQFEFFTQALESMGYKADFSKKTVEGAYRSDGSRDVDCVLMTTNGVNSNIGVKFELDENNEINGVYFVADWYNKRDKNNNRINDESFKRAFVLEYLTARTLNSLSEQSFTVEQVEQVENGKRRIIARRAA
jgi:hypothetical protein